MRRFTSGWLALSTSAVLLLGCNSTEPLEPIGQDAPTGAVVTGSQVAAPSNVTVVATSAVTIRVAWQDNSSNETRFEVFRSLGYVGGGYSLLSSTAANVTAYPDAGLTSPLDYCYQVRAVRTKGSNVFVSSFSSPVCALPPPAAPSNVTAVATSESTIEIAWQDNTVDETQFEVYRATYPTGTPTQSGILASTAQNVTTYLDAGLSPNGKYCYQVVAVRRKDDNAIRSSPSPTVCAVTPPPAPIAAQGTIAVPSSSHGVTVYWSYSSASFDQSSRIERSTDGGAAWGVAGTVYGSRYFSDDGLPSERSVCYRVVHYTAAGEAEPSNTACTTPPAAPSAVTARQVDAQVFELTWSDNSTVEGGYEVRALYRYCSYYYFIGEVCDEYDEVLAVLPANSTRHRVAGVDADYASRITVYAMKDGGYSDPAIASYAPAP